MPPRRSRWTSWAVRTGSSRSSLEPNTDVTLPGETIALQGPISSGAGPRPSWTSTDKGELDGVAELLLDHPEMKTLRIETHCDPPGPRAPSRGPRPPKKLTCHQANANQ